MSEGASGSAQVRWTLDREAELLTSAIYLVAGGAANATTIVGLRLAEAAMTIVRPLADERGLVLEPLWNADEDGCDVHIRRAGPA